MALTDTKKAKEFMAGAPDIKLKGDLRLKASVDEPFYRDNEGDRDEHSFRMFNKPYKELNEFELEEFQEEMMRLMNKFSSAPDPMDERNNALENLADQYYGKPLKDLSPREIELLEEALEEMTMKSAPSMKMASMDDDYDAEFMRLVGEFMERGFSQQEAIDAARDELERIRSKFMADGGRAQYGLGSLVKSVKKAVKGVVKGVKDNPLLAAAALNFAPMLIPGVGKPIIGMGGGMFNIPKFSSLLNLSGAKTGTDAALDALKVGGAGAVITGLLAAKERQPGESDMDFAQRSAQVKDQLDVQFRRLYPQGGNESDEDYDVRISALVEGADDQTVPVGEMADGGRVMRAFGSDKLVEKASGIEGLPINVNSKGVKELDLRETGGFIPPVGVKEKADDIPAMLSNNEFVFTADAVRAAGGGSVNKGAQRMYDLMKNLESKVV